MRVAVTIDLEVEGLDIESPIPDGAIARFVVASVRSGLDQGLDFDHNIIASEAFRDHPHEDEVNITVKVLS